MWRVPVASEAIRSVGYDPAARTLEIEFAQRAVYRYRDVPPAVHAELMAADSLGTCFNARIRDRYPCTRVAQ
jgi:hypothetical protein